MWNMNSSLIRDIDLDCGEDWNLLGYWPEFMEHVYIMD